MEFVRVGHVKRILECLIFTLFLLRSEIMLIAQEFLGLDQGSSLIISYGEELVVQNDTASEFCFGKQILSWVVLAFEISEGLSSSAHELLFVGVFGGKHALFAVGEVNLVGVDNV